MTVSEKVKKLAARVERLIDYTRQLEQDNAALRAEKEQLSQELTTLRAECHRMKLDAADQSRQVTEKLTGVLQRLDELEQLEG